MRSDPLIPLYASRPANFLGQNRKVVAQALGRESMDEFSWFEKEEIRKRENPIRSVKLDLEKVIRPEKQSPEEQVINCLKFSARIFDEFKLSSTYNAVLEKKKQVLRPLIVATYAPKWNERLFAHFNDTFDRLASWNCFFFSFDYSFRPYKLYKKLIWKIIESNQLSVNPKKLKKINSFACLLTEYLIQKQVVGHYHKLPSHEMSPELGEHCAKSLTFIQLINPQILQKIPENICFEQYEIFMDNNGPTQIQNRAKVVQDKCFFVSTEPISNNSIPSKHDNWFQDIVTAKGHSNVCTGNANDFLTFAEQIRLHVLKARNQIIESIPEQKEILPIQQIPSFENNPLEYVENLLSNDLFEEAMIFLKKLSKEKEPEIYDDLLLLQGSFTSLEEENAKGKLSFTEYRVERAKIRDAIMKCKITIFKSMHP